MFKIEFTASAPSEIADMADRMARIAAALRPVGMHPALGAPFTTDPAPVSHVQSVSVLDTSAKRGPGRPRKADPVEAYIAAGGAMPAVTEIDPPATEAEQAAVIEQNVAGVAESATTHPDEATFISEPPTLESEIAQAEATFTPEPPANLDELRAQIRTIAQDRGALWLRPLLEADKVTKVSGLTEATMRAALEAAQ